MWTLWPVKQTSAALLMFLWRRDKANCILIRCSMFHGFGEIIIVHCWLHLHRVAKKFTNDLG